MKKILLGFGSIVSVAIPIVVTVSCGKDDAPSWTLKKIPFGTVPKELGSGYITSGNKDVIIQLEKGETKRDVDDITSQITENTELISKEEDNIEFDTGFEDGVELNAPLSEGVHLFTLSGVDSEGNHAKAITYTFKVMKTGGQSDSAGTGGGQIPGTHPSNIDGSHSNGGTEQHVGTTSHVNEGQSHTATGMEVHNPGTQTIASHTTGGDGHSTSSQNINTGQSHTTTGMEVHNLGTQTIVSHTTGGDGHSTGSQNINTGQSHIATGTEVHNSGTQTNVNTGEIVPPVINHQNPNHDITPPIWTIKKQPEEIIPSEIVGGYITTGNKNIQVELSNTETTYDASSIISKIIKNTMLHDSNEGLIADVTHKFMNGEDPATLSVGIHKYTLSGSDSSGNKAISITYTFIVKMAPVPPSWRIATTQSGLIPPEIGSTYISEGNLDVFIKLTGKTETSYDANHIIDQIKANTKLMHNGVDSALYTSSFESGVDASSLSAENYVYTLHGVDMSPSITYTFKIYNPELMDTQEQWEDYLDDPSNAFESSFIEKAKSAMNWTDNPKGSSNPSAYILDDGFKGITFPSEFKLPKIIQVGNNAFEDAKVLSDFCLPSSVTTVGEYAFKGVVLSSSFIWPKSARVIGDYALAGAYFNDDFIIPSTVVHFGNNCFKGTSFSNRPKIPQTIILQGNPFMESIIRNS
ncbi:MAG: leucine-rich repeat protein [Mycoplasmataceae bacterium]|nr:leucine-rich repeat protein [Mycoplasmataceae bacterium]